jgi:hypothetical protein
MQSAGTPALPPERQAVRDKLTKEYEDEARNSAVKGVGGLQLFREGLGRGMSNVGRNVVNLALPESITPEGFRDEDLQEKKKLDKQLLSTGAGTAGNIVGEIATTLPAGAIGTGARAVKAAKAGNVLARTLGHRATTGALEGAASGLAASAPGERGVGAAIGGGTGGVFGSLGKGLGKWRKLMPKEDPSMEVVRRLQKDLVGKGLMEPIEPGLAQAGKEGSIWRMIYDAGLANFPTVGGKIRNRAANALANSRRMFIAHGAPENIPHPERYMHKSESIEDVLGNIDEMWDEIYEPVRDATYKFRSSFDDMLETGFPRSAKIVKEELKKFGKGGLTDIRAGVPHKGNDVWELRNALRTLAAKEESAAGRRVFSEVADKLDRGIVRQNPLAKEILEKNADRYKNWSDIKAVVHAVKGQQNLTPKRMMDASYESTVRGMKGEAPMQEMTEALHKAQPGFPSRQGLFQTRAAMSLVPTSGVAGLGFLAGGPAGAATALGITLAAANILASPGFQRWMVEQGVKNVTKSNARKLIEKYTAQIGRQAAATAGE